MELARYQLLHHLWNLGDWLRLESKAREFLEFEPDDAYSLLALSIALIKLNRLNEAGGAIRSLAQHEGGDSVEFHSASTSYWLVKGRLDYSWYHAHRLIDKDPQESEHWQRAAGVLLAKGHSVEAYGAILRARSLNPDSTHGVELESRICAAIARTAEDLVRLQHTLDSALSIVPDSANIHELKGDLKIEAMSDRKGAIEHYRTSLSRDPTDENCQKKLIEMIRVSNVFTWALFLPLLSAKFFFRAIANRPIATLIYFTFAFKLTGLVLAWLIPGLFFFLVPSLCFETFFVGDISIFAIRSPFMRWIITRVQNVPFAVRIFGFFMIWMSLVALPPWLMFGVLPQYTLIAIMGLYFFQLAMVVSWVSIKKVDWWFAKTGNQLSNRANAIRLIAMAAALNLMFLILLVVACKTISDDGVALTLIMLGLLVAAVMGNATIILKLLNTFRKHRFEKKIRNLRLPKPGKSPPLP